MKISLDRILFLHKKFKITNRDIEFTDEEKLFRISAIKEELSEYEESKTKEDELDALVDMLVFILGTAERQGFLEVFEKAYNRVMDSNEKKELGTNIGKRRGSFKIDLKKPKNWKSPELKDLVK